MSEIKLSAQDMAVLGKLAGVKNLETSLTSSGWQPQERDVAAVDSMIGRGILAKRPGSDSVTWTEDGQDAYLAVLGQ